MEVIIGFSIAVAILIVLLAATVILGYIGRIDLAILTGCGFIIGIVPQLAPVALIVAVALIIIGHVNYGLTAIVGTVIGVGIVVGTLIMVGIDLNTLSLTDNFWQLILDKVAAQ